jgi:myo-inositol-1(or 4)-monophosphatase
VGCIVAGRPEIGVIYQPATDDLYAARRGAGATRNRAAIAVRDCQRVSDAVVCVEHSARASIDRHVAIVSALLREGAEYRRNGSCAVSLAQIAAGTLDGFVELHVHVWDVLAGLVLIGEAGGRTSDFLAGNGLKDGNALIAAAPRIFDDLVRIGG